MKILIIGGAGFVGTNLVRFCLRQVGAEITVLDSLEPKLRADKAGLLSVMNAIRFVPGSLLDEPLLAELVAGQEIVFNCAAQSSHPLSIQEPLFDAEINCLGNVKLLEALRQRNRQAVVVYASSSTVIGRAVGVVVDESHGEKPWDIYSANKGVAEKYYRIYHKVHDLKTVVLRFANLYGPYGKPFPEFGFVNYFIHVARAGGAIQVFGEGRSATCCSWRTRLKPCGGRRKIRGCSAMPGLPRMTNIFPWRISPLPSYRRLGAVQCPTFPGRMCAVASR